MSEAVSWRSAWQSALYGERGFYRGDPGPAGHFTTATHGATGRALARTLWELADRYDLPGVVDVGAGRGELLRHLYALAPGRPLCGLDVVPRPHDLPDDVGWVESPGGGSLPEDWVPPLALVVAHEWLDVVPCTIAEVGPDGSLREVLVDPATGTESLGHHCPARIISGANGSGPRRWPARREQATASRSVGNGTTPGPRCWTGWHRAPWRSPWTTGTPSTTGPGRGRSSHTGRAGWSTRCRTAPATSPPTSPSTRSDRRTGCASVTRSRPAPAPDHALAAADPAAYLEALADRSAVAALRSPDGFGDFWWVIARV